MQIMDVGRLHDDRWGDACRTRMVINLFSRMVKREHLSFQDLFSSKVVQTIRIFITERPRLYGLAFTVVLILANVTRANGQGTLHDGHTRLS